MLKPDSRRGGLVLLLAGVIAAVSAPTAPQARSAAAQSVLAHSAATLHGTATARLHLVEAEGSELIETGRVTGTLTGTAHAELRTGASFSAKFSIRTAAGSISGHGTAKPHGLGRFQSFSGSFAATGGSGRYKHIHGQASLYGTIDRNTDSVVIQAVSNGTLIY